MNRCKNCNEQINGNYCSSCGQPATLKRIDGCYLIHEIGEFFFANKGLLYTIKRVLISPGESVRQFIHEDRYRFVKPIAFLFITSLIYTFINYFFQIGVEDFLTSQYEELESSPTSLKVMNWMLIDYPGYAGIITGLFIAFWIKIFFKKAGYNIFEIFVLLCFLSGITTLFLSVVATIQGITHIKLLEPLSYLGMLYVTWAIGQFFDAKKAMSYVKAFLSYLLGALVLGFIVGVVGGIIDVVIKQ